jgi:uncharacterized protein YxjI
LRRALLARKEARHVDSAGFTAPQEAESPSFQAARRVAGEAGRRTELGGEDQDRPQARGEEGLFDGQEEVAGLTRHVLGAARRVPYAPSERMDEYEVTQVLLSVGTVYHVRRPRQEELLYTVKGVLMSATPKFHLVEGDAGKEIGKLEANFIKTKYEIHDDAKLLATLVFPAVALKKTLTLTVGADEYEADGGVFKGVFQCKSKDGSVALEIAKELSIRDTFSVKALESLPFQVGLLSAVAIHSRFYEMV